MKTCILLSQGYEETEAVTVIDYLRRAEIPVDVLATEGDLNTVGDHGIHITADKLLENSKADDYDMVITPGGLPGTQALCANSAVINLFKQQHTEGKYLACICASPLVLKEAGISPEITGTIFKGMEDQMDFGHYKDELVVYDAEKKVITSQGPATAVYFALKIIEVLKGKEARDQVAEGLLLPKVEAALKE